MTSLGKMLMVVGIVLVVVGALLFFLPRIPFLGKLPGDIYIKKEKFVLYFPLATSILISALLSLILWLFRSK